MKGMELLEDMKLFIISFYTNEYAPLFMIIGTMCCSAIIDFAEQYMTDAYTKIIRFLGHFIIAVAIIVVVVLWGLYLIAALIGEAS